MVAYLIWSLSSSWGHTQSGSKSTDALYGMVEADFNNHVKFGKTRFKKLLERFPDEYKEF